MTVISKLATTQYLTDKHWEQRDSSKLRFIISHHMANKSTGENCAKYFVSNGKQNSANYCIGYAGDISCNVPEEYGAWTSSFWGADKYGITFEVSDTAYGDWTIPEAAQESMINLMVDIFERYPSLGGKAIFDPSDESEVVAAKRGNRNIGNVKGNILLHKWTSAYGTTCPEWHMVQILPQICEEVNRRLEGEPKTYTVREAAQKMIDDNINGKERVAWCKENGLIYADVQNEINLMLGKDRKTSIYILSDSLPEISYGSSGDVVALLQNELKHLGYYNGEIDSHAGTLTVNAIDAIKSNWNKVYGNFSSNKTFDSKCWKRLFTGE